jgi:PEP-CTERM motif
VAFNGPPGLGAGNSTDIEVIISVPSSGPETFEVVLTPTAVPEPSTWAMMLLGFAGLGYAGYRRRCARLA